MAVAPGGICLEQVAALRLVLSAGHKSRVPLLQGLDGPALAAKWPAPVRKRQQAAARTRGKKKKPRRPRATG